MPLENELSELLNRHSAENDSDTPDFVLARFLLDCLAAWNAAAKRRDRFYVSPEDIQATGAGAPPMPRAL